MKPLTLIGIGGFGKWVVTFFKDKLLDIYGEDIPQTFKWIAFDLTGQESPRISTLRFKKGKKVNVELDFSDTSFEFYKFSGDYLHEIEKIKNENMYANNLIKQFMTKEDANQYIIDANRRGAPAGERRHTSRITFFLDVKKIEQRLNETLQDNSLIFVVNSLAGGTGCGSFIDFLILLYNLIRKRNLSCQLINIFSLPKCFVKAKEGEDLKPLMGNCYASFREFRRLDYPESKIKISYSTSDTTLIDLQKPTEILSNIVYFIDGYKVAGQEGDKIKYFHGIVPAIANFIEDFALLIGEEEERKQREPQTQTALDNIISHISSNRIKAKNTPENSGIYASLGNYRLIFDKESIKKEFSQKIAIDVLNHFLTPSYLEGSALEDEVQNFFLSGGTRFDHEFIYGLKDPDQVMTFASRNQLRIKIQKVSPRFPEINFGNLQLKGTVAQAKGIIDGLEKRRMGKEEDKYPRENTFYGILNYYKDHYKEKFQEKLRSKVLEILNKDKGEETYGKGALKSTLSFLSELKVEYENFLQKFNTAIKNCESIQQNLKNIDKKADDFYRKNWNKKRSKLIQDLRVKYANLRTQQNEKLQRDELQRAVIEIATNNLKYIGKLQQWMGNWIYTFEKGIERTKKAMDDLKSVRNIKKSFVCHRYLTSSEDEYESWMYEVIRDKRKRDAAVNYTGYEEKELRKKEIVQKLPSPSWAELVNGFSWVFNVKDERGNLPYPDYEESEPVCTLPEGMPKWPKSEQWKDEDFILTWNYQFTENYLILGHLGDIDRITVIDMLLWMGEDAPDIISELESKAMPMLQYDGNKDTDLGKEYRVFNKEKRIILSGNFTPSTERGRALANQIRELANNKGYSLATGVDNQLSLTCCEYNLFASAMENLMVTRDEYLRRLKDKVPPPLHVFKGERIAYEYEFKISDYFKTPFEELHPVIICALEDELLVKNFIFGQIFGLIREKEEIIEGNKETFLVMDNEKIELKLPFSPVQAINRLRFPKEEEIELSKAFINELNKQVSNLRLSKDRNEYISLLEASIKRYEKILSSADTKIDSDLIKLSIIILKDELDELKGKKRR